MEPLPSIPCPLDEVEGVDLDHLPPDTTLLVKTQNSLYRVVVTGPETSVQGGMFLPVETSAYVGCLTSAGIFVRRRRIDVGLLMEIFAGYRRIVTTPVQAIWIESCQ